MLITRELLEPLGRGCAVLGAGGGGAYHGAVLAAEQAIDECGPVPVVAVEDLEPDDLVMPCGQVGAPTVSLEKPGSGREGELLRARIEALTGKRVRALMASEIGGANGLQPIVWAARMGLPVVDADGMGRAFPEMQQVSMHVAGISPSPCVMADERGTVAVYYPVDGRWLERMCRTAAVAFGGSAASSEYLMTASQLAQATVLGSVSRALSIGQILAGRGNEPFAEMLQLVDGICLIEGKLVDVERRVSGGFVRGTVSIMGLRNDSGRVMRLELQNENLVALEEGRVVASVPDIITVVDTHTGDAVNTELLRHAQRVTVVAFPCDPLWRSAEGLEVVGPRAFGYDFDYKPVEVIHSDR